MIICEFILICCERIDERWGGHQHIARAYDFATCVYPPVQQHSSALLQGAQLSYQIAGGTRDIPVLFPETEGRIQILYCLFVAWGFAYIISIHELSLGPNPNLSRAVNRWKYSILSKALWASQVQYYLQQYTSHKTGDGDYWKVVCQQQTLSGQDVLSYS